jgi:hypothetical protein
MAFQQSPGVNFSEIDISTIVPGVGTTVGAFAGKFNWGPVEEIITLSNEINQVDRFGKPDQNTFVSFFTVANFLAYAQDIKVVRASNTAQVNATANANGVLIKNRGKYDESFSAGSVTYGTFAAKYAGDLGNSLRVETFPTANTVEFNTWAYKSLFDAAPSTSTYASGVGGANDEMHIVVVDRGGKFSGVANTVLERFAFTSKAQDAVTSDGSSNFYKNIINDKSKYVWWMGHPTGTNWSGNNAAGITFTNIAANTYTLSGGVTAQPTDAELITAYRLFGNQDSVDISLVMLGDANTTVAIDVINNVAEVRKDLVAFISPERNDVVDQAGSEANNITTTRDTLPSSSYAFMDGNWKYQFDKYNNVYRWLPYNGDVAGLAVRTDLERDAWFSFAGFNRGNIKNVIKSAWNPSKADRDTLYKKGVNPIVSFPGEGTILFGDKTMLAKPSAFDRINVRRLFLVVEKAITKAAKFSLFEFNDEFTRAQFVNLVEPFLRDVKGRRGIFDFRVVCDETNNTPEVIDRNEFVGDIYIKPAKSINFIQLNFVATRTGVAFEEIVGRF